MAQEEQALIREVVRSIDKKCTWETRPGEKGALEFTLRLPAGHASAMLSAEEIAAAADSGMAFYRLRERIKRLRKRIRDSRPPYMPWRLPKVEPIGAPGPRGGGGWASGPRR